MTVPSRVPRRMVRKRSTRSQERTDHRHHFDVAHPHAFLFADELIECGRAPQEHAAEQCAEDRVEYVEE